MFRTFRCLTAVLILALLAGAGAAQALPVAQGPGQGTVQFESPGVKVWGWIVAIVQKAGSFIDPNGNWLLPAPDPALPTENTTNEAGSFIDPNGNS